MVITYGLEKAPFNSHTREFVQAFTRTRTQDKSSFPNRYLLTRVTVYVHEADHCVHSLGAIIHSMRHTVYRKSGKERSQERKEAGTKVGERVSEEETREREVNKHSRVVKYLSTEICLGSLVPTGRYGVRPLASPNLFHCLSNGNHHQCP